MERIEQRELLKQWLSSFLSEFISVSILTQGKGKKIILALLLIIFIIIVAKGQSSIDSHYSKRCTNTELTI